MFRLKKNIFTLLSVGFCEAATTPHTLVPKAAVERLSTLLRVFEVLSSNLTPQKLLLWNFLLLFRLSRQFRGTATSDYGVVACLHTFGDPISTVRQLIVRTSLNKP
jgi:hypothetical protein